MKLILKTWQMMKLIVFLILLGVLRVNATVSAQTYRVNLSFENVTLGKIIDALKEQTKLEFFFSNKELDIHKKMSVFVEDEDMEKVLKRILGKGYGFRIYENVVIIRPVKEEKTDSTLVVKGVVRDEKGVPLPGVTIRLKGKMLGTSTDKNGRFSFRIPVVKNEQIVLVFSFVGMETKELVYKQPKDPKKEWAIVLKESLLQLGEVVVNTGYQRINLRNLTSSVTTIKASDIVVPGLNSIDKMLEGYIPGMIFMQNSGQVGATPRLRIRGTSTVLGSQEPLWVVDGIVVTDPVSVDASQINDLDFVNLLGNAIAGLNPNDIEQIDVLKDAAATALYGSRAANGVIVITTKKGEIGAPSVRYSFSGTFSRRPHYSDKAVNMMNAAERIDLSREIVNKKLSIKGMSDLVGYEDALIRFYSGEYDFKTFQRVVSLYESVNTDWFAELTRNVFSHNHSVSISGGSEGTRYYASIGYLDERGVLIGEGYKRYTANVNVDMNYNRFSVHFGLLGNVSDKRYTPLDVGLLDYAYNTSRAIPVYKEDGNLWYYQKVGSDGFKNFNILNERDNSYDKMKGNGLNLNLALNYNFTDWLRTGLTLSYSTDNTYRDIYHGEKTYYAAMLRRAEEVRTDDYYKRQTRLPYGGELKKDDTQKNAYVVRFQIDVNKYLDKEQCQMISASAGGEISSTNYVGMRKTYRCYIPERGKIINAADPGKYVDYAKWLATDREALGIIKDELTNLASTYASLSYNYKDLYILNANMRIDASNAFGDKSNDKILPIWSVSGRWNMAENILRHVSWVGELALRASWGWQGNMLNEISPELLIQKGEVNDDYGQNVSTIKNYPNPDLRWEKTMSTNFTLDFSLLNNKICGSISYFYKQTKDAFLSKTISEINGVSMYTVNKGTLRNQGIEVAFNFNPITTGRGRDAFVWRFDPQIGQVINKLIDRAVNRNKTLHDEVKYQDYLSGSVEVAGRPLNTFYSYKFKGLDPKDGRPMFNDIDQTIGEAEDAIDVKDKYQGMSKDGVFQTVMEHSGTRVPYIQGGISNTFSYKGFILSLNLTYSLGSKVRLLRMYSNVNSFYGTIAPLPIQNVRKEFLKRWKRPGDEEYTTIPALIANNEFMETMEPWWIDKSYKFAENIWQMYDNSNIRVVSGDYLKMQSFSLRYVVPEGFCRKMKMQSVYLNFSGTNLFTLCSCKLKGQDPTQSGSSGNINLSLRPSYSMGIDVTF